MKKAHLHKHNNKTEAEETNPGCKWLHNYKEIKIVIKKRSLDIKKP